MYAGLFRHFLDSSDSLQVYAGTKLVFASDKAGLAPLLEYIDSFYPCTRQTVIFDKIMGNAAALLCVLANCQEIYSPLGSQIAIQTLKKNCIKYHFTNIVAYIQKPDREDMCTMETLSMNKEPKEFYESVRKIVSYSEKVRG